MFLLNNLLLIDIPSGFHKLNIILTHFSFFFFCMSTFGCNALWKQHPRIIYLTICKSLIWEWGMRFTFKNFTNHWSDMCQWISFFGLLNIKIFNRVIQYLDCKWLSIRWIADLKFITCFFPQCDSFNHKPNFKPSFNHKP